MKARNLVSSAVYLNVDLEVRSQSDLRPLIEALSRFFLCLYAGRVGRSHFASFELNGMTGSPDLTIRRMAEAISGLPRPARSLWNHARDRVFDIGLERAEGARVFAVALNPQTVKTVAQLGARIAVTLYPPAKRGKLPNRLLQRQRPPRASSSSIVSSSAASPPLNGKS